MSTVASPLRAHPELAELFKASEARHMSTEELERYLELAPAEGARVRAAREVAAIEGDLVRGVVTEVLSLFPFEESHKWSSAKCSRDVRAVSAYCTLSMLMDDVQWLDDKLLIWLRTILHAFDFPAKKARKKALLFKKRAAPQGELSPKAQSIWDTYSRLRDGYRKRLSPESWALMEPSLQRVVDTLV